MDLDRRALRRYAVGDVAAIVLFVVLGEFSHGANPLLVLGSTLTTVGTFLLGWIVVAGPGGAYGERTLSEARAAVLHPIGLWAVADLLAQAVRATAAVPGHAALSFYLVALIVGGALLGGQRYALYRIDAWPLSARNRGPRHS
ncbi:MAG: DUF3054 domain-containing protein [Halanaeroarchaeum sp.]